MAITVDQAPAASLDQMSGAVGYVREVWGDYGYRVSYRGSDLFVIHHRDMAWDNPATFLCDRFGNVYEKVEG